MAEAIFFRLLQVDVEDKPAALLAQLEELNFGDDVNEVFTASDRTFANIPGSPFAYWVGNSIRDLFTTFKTLGSNATAQHGASSKSDFRFLRLWWEPEAISIGTGCRWLPFAKGGQYSQYYADVYLLINWENNAEEINEYVLERYPYLRPKENDKSSRTGTEWILHPENFYGSPGLTWPRRTTSGISFRTLPTGCIFADKGPAMFVANDNPSDLLGLLGIVSSTLFEALVKLQLGAAAAAARSYEVGIIQSTPIPNTIDNRLAPLALRAHDLQRERFLSDETTHVFHLPALVAVRGESLAAASLVLAAREAERAGQFAAVQAQIDEIAFDLYGLDEADRQLVMRETSPPAPLSIDGEGESEGDEPEEDDEAAAPNDLPAQVLNLLMWCVGVAFGRWDVRKALDPSLFPPLPEPFDPLPRCAPGALMNADGLPAAQADVPGDYPLPIAWDGILVDDPAQEDNPQSLDIVARVRGVLTLLWGEDLADAVEAEICRVLEYRDLRAIFRDARQGLFAFHIKRYSKSRRKAPIYWLLQTGARSPNYGMWLYYPRIDVNTLFIAEDIAYKKTQRENFRLNELKQGLEALDRKQRKERDAEIAAQTRLVDEVTGFHSKLRQLANLGLPPDHNDGVLISIAPLHELVPWREAAAMWTKLTRGEYPWSTMSQRMNVRGLITGKG